MKVASREVHMAGVTRHPDEEWMKQVARNLTLTDWGFLRGCRYLIMDRDAKFAYSFRAMLKRAGVQPLVLPWRSPNLNAFAERWVRSVKEECLSKMVLWSESALRHVLGEYLEHFHHERCHQGVGNRRLFGRVRDRVGSRVGRICRRSRLGGLLNSYRRAA